MPKKSVIVPAAIEVLKEYKSRITIRQLFYRLVTKVTIPNTGKSYRNLVQQIIKARRQGKIPFEVFEDRTRHSVLGENVDPNVYVSSCEDDFDGAVETYENRDEDALLEFERCSSEYWLPLWYKQPVYVEVWLEKEALANSVESIAAKFGCTFVSCRGYPSLSLLYDCSLRLSAVPVERKKIIVYAGDFDMRGLNIEESIAQNFKDDFDLEVEVVRCALTKEQIIDNALPPQSAKKTDTMARGWIETHGDVAWELDALEPHLFENIIEKAIQNQIDTAIMAERNETIRSGEEWIRTHVAEYLESNE